MLALTPTTVPAGLRNFRDLGGLPAAGGRTTRSGLVYRSESLHGLSEEDVAILVDLLGVRNVIDLRAALELAAPVPAWTERVGVAYTNLPFSDGFDEIDPLLDRAGRRELVRLKYESYLARAGAKIVAALENVADAADRSCPTVFNCTFGKDRTGVLAALLLEILEVERAAVIADYVASASAMDELLDRMKDDPVHGARIPHTPEEVYLAEEHSMRVFLADLDARGGAAQWAVRNGLAPATVGRLRAALLT